MSDSAILDPKDIQQRRPIWLEVGISAVAAILYFGIGKLSLLLAFEQANTSAVWPPSGLAVGGLVVFGIRFWPVVTAGVLMLTLSINPLGVFSAATIALGNTLEAVVGAMLINRFAEGKNCLRGAATVFRFIVYGAVLPALLSAVVGVIGLAVFAGMPWAQFGEIFFTWYTGNLAGILVFAPPVILWSIPRRPWSRRQMVEAGILLVVLILVGQAICGIFMTGTLEKWPSAYMVIPVLLWAPFRLGRRGTVVALIVLMGIAVAGTVRGFEVFPGETPNLSLLYLQIFLSVVSMMSLAVAGLVSELRLANEMLEQKVASRTRRLREMVQEKDDLMAIAAHDLRAPLAGMRNLLDVVRTRRGQLSKETATRVIREMMNTTDGMLDLVSSLLVAKGAEEVGRNLTLVSCDAVQLLERMVGVSRQVGDSKHISIHVEAPEKMIVQTHPESFSQIASNLLSNAVKFSPPGKDVEVRLQGDSSKRNFTLEVRDHGPGIDPAEVDAIYEKFSRAGNRPTGGEASHGIGLYIVDRLVSALHGEVDYSSAKGGGACFRVTLPSGMVGT